jgi:hypothetical protein
MRKSRFSETQIVGILKDTERGAGRGSAAKVRGEQGDVQLPLSFDIGSNPERDALG